MVALLLTKLIIEWSIKILEQDAIHKTLGGSL